MHEMIPRKKDVLSARRLLRARSILSCILSKLAAVAIDTEVMAAVVNHEVNVCTPVTSVVLTAS